MKTYAEDSVRQRSRRLADLQNQTDELERRLVDARGLLQRELHESGYLPSGYDAAGADTDDTSAGYADSSEAAAGCRRDVHAAEMTDATEVADVAEVAEPTPADAAGHARSGGPASRLTTESRTEALVTSGHHGRANRKLTRLQLLAVASAVVAVLVTTLVLVTTGGSASWPASVATMQAQTARACKNPDVASEPGQVNFACTAATRQILWVFALMTSGGRPGFTDATSGRMGLEPITPAQGGEIAWSLNLHHPYNPAHPVDSLQVAARAINNIVGGATATNAKGEPVIQPGLESTSANCIRYTGSAALRKRPGFPSLCARPVSVPAGQAALVSDIYQKWMVGAAPQAAANAAVLFENADNPGDPQVQSILRDLRHRFG